MSAAPITDAVVLTHRSSRGGVVFWPRAIVSRRRPSGGGGSAVVIPETIAEPLRPVSFRVSSRKAMNDPVVLRESCRRQLAALLDRLRAAEVPHVVAERCAMDLAGAFAVLHEVHHLDEMGRCSVCWSASWRWWWPWPSRSACSIDTVLSLCLGSVEQAATSMVPAGV